MTLIQYTEDVLKAVLANYAQGFFPMADQEDDTKIDWFTTKIRAQLPIENFHVGRSLRKQVLRNLFEIRVDTAFEEVMLGCMENRPGQWINDEIRALFAALHRAGHTHSLECWQDNKLVGGIYGLSLGGAFCAESMFSRAPNASKVALVHLCARLNAAGFTVLDCQYLNDHTESLGAYEIPHEEYLRRLHNAIHSSTDFETCKNIENPQKLVEFYLKKQKPVENLKRSLTIS
jgi:leucyl/phenylalanyl-tRNA--protein transferase